MLTLRRFVLGVAAIVLLTMGCAAVPTPAQTEREARTTAGLDGAWHLETLPPEPATQLTHGCYDFLALVHYSDPQLTFAGERVHVRAQSCGNLLTWSDDWFDFTRDGDELRVDTSQWRRPPSALIPCGAIPDAITISPGGERLLVNVAYCSRCAREASIDGVVGLTFVRTQ